MGICSISWRIWRGDGGKLADMERRWGINQDQDE
jgi:hypothetical protein